MNLENFMAERDLAAHLEGLPKSTTMLDTPRSSYEEQRRQL
jgi:hypothetical protein